VSFLKSWADFAGSNSEVPLNFHEAVAMSLLSFFVGQRVTIQTSNARPLTSRINSVLIGKSGTGKRIAMLDWGYKLLEEANKIDPTAVRMEHGENLYVQGSNSSLLHFIINKCGGGKRGLILAEEISGILGHKGDYTQGINTTLAQGLDDSPFAAVGFHSWKDKGWETHGDNPFLVGVFGSTEAWLRDAMDTRSAIAGLPGRMLWHIGNRQAKAKPFGEARTEKEWAEIAKEFLACITIMSRVYVVNEFEGGLREFYDNWYEKFNTRMAEGKVSPLMESWVSRLNIWLLRLAVIMSVEQRRSELTLEIMVAAADYLEGLEKPMTEILHGLSANEEDLFHRHVVVMALDNSSAEFMSKAELRKATVGVFGNSSKQFDKALETLKSQGLVVWQKATKGYVLVGG
jgi:biotin operon repressor